MDKTLSMEQQVRAVTKSCFHQILNIDGTAQVTNAEK
jgi:hypothetical protein